MNKLFVFALLVLVTSCRTTSSIMEINPAELAAAGEYAQVLEALRADPRLIHSVDARGRPIIYHAIMQDQPAWVIYFALNGVDLEIKVNYLAEYSPNLLHLAIYYGHGVSVVSLLHSLLNDKAGKVDGRVFTIDADMRRYYRGPTFGAMYIHFAAYHSSGDVVRYLARHLPVDITDDVGNTPIFYAIQNSNFDATRALLDAGAFFPQKPSNLASCLPRSSPIYIKWALDHGLSEPDRDNRGNTIFHYLAMGGRLINGDLLNILCKAGWIIGIPNNEGKLPIDIAKDRKDEHIIKLFENAHSCRE